MPVFPIILPRRSDAGGSASPPGLGLGVKKPPGGRYLVVAVLVGADSEGQSFTSLKSSIDTALGGTP